MSVLMDEFSYPIRSYDTPWRKCYVYKCHICHKEISGYYVKRVKGNITCQMCRNNIQRAKAQDLKKRLWMDEISRN